MGNQEKWKNFGLFRGVWGKIEAYFGPFKAFGARFWPIEGGFGQIWAYLGGLCQDLGLLGPYFGLFKDFGARFWPIAAILGQFGPDFGLLRGFGASFRSIWTKSRSIQGFWGQILAYCSGFGPILAY